jgi:hypothetical protein
MPTFTSCGTCSSRVAAPRSELERRGESSPTPLHRAGSAAGSASLLKRAAAAAAPAAAAAAGAEGHAPHGTRAPREHDVLARPARVLPDLQRPQWSVMT